MVSCFELYGEKKQFYHIYLDNKMPANWQTYQNAHCETKEVVAFMEAVQSNVYKKLEKCEGEGDNKVLMTGAQLWKSCC